MNDSPTEARKTPGALRLSVSTTSGSSIPSPTVGYRNCLRGASALTVAAGRAWRSVPHAASVQAAREARTATAERALTRPVLAVGVGPRVRLEVDLLQAPAREMCVELCGGHVGVAEHLLHRAQVAAPREQVGCERVAQSVGTHAVCQTSRLGMAANDLVEPLARERPAAEVHEQVLLLGLSPDELGPAPLEIDANGGQGPLPHRHDALLGALSPRAQEAVLEVQVGHGEGDRLRGP